MEQKLIHSCEISTKLTTHGRYVWTITITAPLKDRLETVKELKEIDNHLRDEFPDHIQKGSGRAVNIEGDE